MAGRTGTSARSDRPLSRQNRFARLYDKMGDQAFAIEVEFKVTRDGKLIVKQARPWID